MNIDDKQRLWSKYYLTHEAFHDNLFSLREFIESEVKSLQLPENTTHLKRRKIARYMLRYLPKKHILKKYCGPVRMNTESDKSKNEIIERLVRFI